MLVALEQLDSVLLAVLLEQRVAEIVGPGPGRAHEPRFDLRHVVAGPHPAGRVHDVLHADQQRLAQLERPVQVGAAEGLDQDPPHPLAVLGVEPITRDRDQAGHEPVEGVGAHEQAESLALSQTEDPHRDREQLIVLDLEQGVARVALEDVDQALGVVAVGGEAGAVEHALHLPAEQRDVARAGLVGRRRVEAEEAPLADHLAVGVEALDPDVVEVRGAVNG